MSAAVETSSALEVPLRGGMLRLTMSQPALARLDTLCGFASRLNPKRSFLFVSRVLGKHIPVRPSAMLASHRDLALRLRPFLQAAKETLFIGFAETATGLGAGVYDACQDLCDNGHSLFMQTTRYQFQAEVALHFQEEHSHSTGHLLYEPSVRAHVLRQATSVVLVDDELSTGKTSANFVRALRTVNPRIQRVALVSLLNWMSDDRRRQLRQELSGLDVEFVSLVDGSFEFTPREGYVCPPMPNVDSLPEPKDSVVEHSFGRFGHVRHPALNMEAVLNRIARDPTRPVHVIGDGEFLHPPFLFALELEQRGFDVRFQSTTRSPILEGGAIGSRLCFTDHYGDGIENYIYNLPTDAQLILCHETTSSVPVLARHRAMATVAYRELLCA